MKKGLTTEKTFAIMLNKRIPWNKGTRGLCKPNATSFKKGDKAALGNKWSLEARRRLSKALKGRKTWNKGKSGIYSEETLGKMRRAKEGFIPWNKGKRGLQHQTEELRRKSSERQRGEKNQNWRGGATPINARIRKTVDFKLWREAVFKRDDYTCIRCLQRNGDKHPHHILSFADFPEERFEVDNGATLCVPCHRYIHKNENNRQN